MIRFAGLEFKRLTKESLFQAGQKCIFLVTANSEIIVKANEDKNYRAILEKAECSLDGQIPYALARLLNKKISIEKISGSDLIYDVCSYAHKNHEKIFLLGAAEESNTGAVEKLHQRFHGLQVKGYSPPFESYPFSASTENQINKLISDFLPHYIFVGFGAGKQEMWIHDHLEWLEKQNVKMVVGSGGTFEFVSGKILRAPRFLQVIGLEGVFRLVMEPKLFRLKRLLKSFKIFFYAFKN